MGSSGQLLFDSERINNLFDNLRIVVTEPRKIAAISMAKRICNERSIDNLELVSYSVRFDDKSTAKR